MQETGGDTPLTDLCAICHANPIKYTCPRCAIHTCSLPCVRRHKTWAQCSGVRDPATYRPRSELATASSVDQDFNFISSVERSLSKADDLVLAKGIALAPSGLKRDSHDVKRRFDEHVEKSGITVIKAPQGLSRSKRNKSQWVRQHKRIMWTTEWLCSDGEIRTQNVPDTITVAEAFVRIWGKKGINRKKRKRTGSETKSVPTAGPETSAQKPNIASQNSDETKQMAPEEVIPADKLVDNNVVNPTLQFSIRPNAVSDDAEAAEVSDISNLVDGLHFYLHRPNTPSKVKCVIPLSPFSTIHDVLRDRVVLEYPTFFVRDEDPDSLPEPFITEQNFDAAYGAQTAIDLPVYAPEELPATTRPPGFAAVDENKVLEVLQKDLID